MASVKDYQIGYFYVVSVWCSFTKVIGPLSSDKFGID
jgi:hypothetical protein